MTKPKIVQMDELLQSHAASLADKIQQRVVINDYSFYFKQI
jgi:hypothetical protein